MVRSQLVRGAGDKAGIAIVRKGQKGEERIIADEETELQPGDTVEVALHYQDAPEAALQAQSSSKTQPNSQ
jgi:polysaccharide export outer membrane protein